MESFLVIRTNQYDVAQSRLFVISLLSALYQLKQDIHYENGSAILLAEMFSSDIHLGD
jgi:hypothetical protein